MFRKIIIKIKIEMAISYSYPMGTPKLTDTVLGVQYEEAKDPAVKNFSISNIVNLAVDEVGIPTLQDVTGEGANTTIQMQINGVDVATLDDIPETPTLQSVTDNGNDTTNTIAITTGEVTGLNVEGFRWGIRANNSPDWVSGSGIDAYSEQGYGVYATCGEFGDGGIYASSGVKPGGGSWTASSDARVKENIEAYSKGLEDILLINPVTYDYNGKGGMPKSTGYIGIIAQEIKDIFPETITTYKSRLEETDTEDTELYRFESSALTYALINAVKELKAEIELLKGN
jgi:hypothetical protein